MKKIDPSDICTGKLYGVVGFRGKVFRVKGFNDTKEHGRRAVVEHHDEKAMIVPLNKIKRTGIESVNKYLGRNES